MREDLDKLEPLTEEILYVIHDSDALNSTPRVCAKMRYKETLVRSRLRKLRDLEFVRTKSAQEYGGTANPTNYYSSTSKASEYERQHGLSVPKHVLIERIDEFQDWREFIDEWTEIAETRFENLDERVDRLE